MFSTGSGIVIAAALLRSVTGILFFFQGYDKIFKVKIPNVINAFINPYSTNGSSMRVFIKPAVYISSWLEFVGGAFLFLGFFRMPVLLMLSVDLLFVSIAFSIMKPMWDMQHFFPRMLFIILLLIIPSSWDLFSLDALLGITGK